MDKPKNNEAKIYAGGNTWQNKVYRSMAEYLNSISDIKSYGHSLNGIKYRHLLIKEQSQFNFITNEIYEATIKRFNKHKAGDLNRILTNTAASQSYCFNLFIYLQQNLHLANRLFSTILNKEIKVHHIEPEFTPNHCNDIPLFELYETDDESIGDQNLKLGIGTDADIAIFYTYDLNKKGILLIEFKFIEAGFSKCTSYAKKKCTQSICMTKKFYNELVETKDTKCGYNKYFNWILTKNSKVFDIKKIKQLNACPFRYGLNQLWRNMLLAEQVASVRKCDEFGFYVFSPLMNKKFLWKDDDIEKQFRNILTEKGNNVFKNIILENILDKLNCFVENDQDKYWLKMLNRKYRII